MKRVQGFTLIEMVTVMVLLGILAVGLTGFIRLVTQIYADTTDNEALVAEARFAVERLSRELRRALPNSIHVDPDNNSCINYTPIIASAIYRDIPVAPDPAQDSFEIVAFSDFTEQNFNGKYAVIYPLSIADGVFGTGVGADNGKISPLATTNAIERIGQTNRFTVNLRNNIRFSEESPTRRAFFVDDPVQICLTANQVTFAGATLAANVNVANSSFNLEPANLQRNGIVQMLLTFNTDITIDNNGNISFDGIDIEFYQEVHIANVP